MNGQQIGLASLLLVPGIYFIWFSVRKEAFFRQKKWQNWYGRASLFALILWFPDRIFGPLGARLAFGLVGFTISIVGFWVLSLPDVFP